jgi:glycerol-3-phosphate dehydrogenase
VRRNIAALAEKEYDVVIVGGGIFGVCAAWDATLRGLAVALVEKEDFAHATSAHCFKIVHGGIRYLQHADFVRVRTSSRERSALLRVAPHLVRPLPVVVPTYGHGMKGKEVLAAGLLLYDLLTCDRNRGIHDPERRLPRGRLISRQEVLDLFPGVKREGLTGGALFYDGQMYSPQRLALSFLRSAVDAGAEAANYMEATALLRSGGRTVGIEAVDTLSGERVRIRAKGVLNAAGPWAESFLRTKNGLRLHPEGTYSRDACFVVRRRVVGECALAVTGRTKDPDALLSRQHRHLFLAPWRDYTLVGVWHVVHKGLPGEFAVSAAELQGFIDEVNEAYPALRLTLDDVSMWNAGLVLFGDNRPGAVDLSYGKRSRIVDHAGVHGVQGLVTLIGVRYTTARGDAAQAVDLLCEKLGRRTPRPPTAEMPIYGGQIACFESFLRQAITQRPPAVPVEAMRPLVHGYGSEYKRVLRYLEENPEWAETVGDSTVLKAEVVHAVREEMAQKLSDVVLRRTELGTGGHPGDVALRACADVMAAELGWDETRRQKELREVRAAFPQFLTRNSRGVQAPDGAPLREGQVAGGG